MNESYHKGVVETYMKNFSAAYRTAPGAINNFLSSILIFLAVLAFTAGSYMFFDTRVSTFLFEVIHGSDVLEQATSGIPDVLLHIVAVITAISWAGYFFLTRKGVCSHASRFLRLCGTSVPLAFVIKTILQYVFGRVNTEAWTLYHQLPRFYWFRAGEGYGSFPSGHMTVFTALVVSFWQYYPHRRLAGVVFLSLLALALIATNYHFVSDVIAGAYFGLVVTLIAARER